MEQESPYWFLYRVIAYYVLPAVLGLLMAANFLGGGRARAFCKDSAFNRKVADLFADNHYFPTVYLFHPVLKMLLNLVVGTPVDYDTKVVELVGDGPKYRKKPSLVEKELGSKPLKVLAAWYPSAKSKSETLLVIIPGHGQHHKEWTMGTASQEAYKLKKWTSVVYNKLGYVGVPNDGYEVYYYHRHDLFEDFVRQAKAECGATQVVLIGYSMGGMFVYNYLANMSIRLKQGGAAAEQLKSLNIKAGVAVAPAWFLPTTGKKVDNHVLFRPMMWDASKKDLKRWIEENPNKFATLGATSEMINSIEYNLEYELKYVSKWAGYDDYVSYCRDVCDPTKLPEVSVPLLCISSESDPLIDNHAAEEKYFKNNENIFHLSIKDGGHVEFPTGLLPRNWASHFGIKYLDLVLSKNASN